MKKILMNILYSSGYFESNSLLFVFLMTWIFEWFYIFNSIFCLNTYVSFSFPYSLPVLLLVIFLYFMYMWSISVWRRTQYGKFTSGDRELWMKGYASFWVLEISTIVGIVVVAAWMNWGPIPLFPRNFNISKKSFLIELTLFTYIIWVLYLSSYLMKWNKWNTQMVLTLVMLLFMMYLVWRDLLMILGRESLTMNTGVSWSFIEANTALYSLSKFWWIKTFINKDTSKYTFEISPFLHQLAEFLSVVDINADEPMMNLNKNFITFEKYNYMTNLEKNPILNKLNVDQMHFLMYQNDLSNIYYHRRVGFATKRMSMWTFLFFLKIWHHLMLFIWWFIYLMRLFFSKKNSYQLTAVCLFNVYCCFLIIFFIYMYCLFPKLIIFFSFFKDKPKMISWESMYGWKFLIVDYLLSMVNNTYFLKMKSLYYIKFEKMYYFNLYSKDYKFDDIYDYDFYSIDSSPEYMYVNEFFVNLMKYYLKKNS